MSGFKVKVYASNSPKDTVNGQSFNLPIIPRVGDYIDVKYKPDPIKRPLNSVAGVFEVKNVFIHEADSTYDAHIHVLIEEEIE
ncbi:hypothetical protein LG276_00985 [Cytobacillus kochii]|uniref:hypothetical protein n=1 Tax=Cytobacillus TaxID=2675230 RepID=UPI0030F87013